MSVCKTDDFIADIERQFGLRRHRAGQINSLRSFVLVLDSLFRLFEGEGGKTIEDEDAGRRTRTIGRAGGLEAQGK
jgi:hypothetical protein